MTTVGWMAIALLYLIFLMFVFRNELGGSVKPQTKSETKQDEESSTENIVENQTKEITPSDSIVGISTFDQEAFFAKFSEVLQPMVEKCFAAAIETKDVEMDNSASDESNVSSKRMTPEQEAAAFNDYRKWEDALDKEDNSVAPPNPLASGVGFEQIAEVAAIVSDNKEPTPEEHKFVFKIYKQIRGTELTARLPKPMLEKLFECHRKVEENPEAFKDIPDLIEAHKKSVKATKRKAIPDFSNFDMSDYLPKSSKQSD